MASEKKIDSAFSIPIRSPPPRPKGSPLRSPSYISSSPLLSSRSSSGSSLTNFHDDHSEPDHPFSPISPLHHYSRIPFSWEQIPGIPKQQIPNKNKKHNPSSLTLLLPLPPGGNRNSIPSKKFHPAGEITPIRKKYSSKDPFFMALVECSKDGHHHGHDTTGKISRTLSDRFGFINMYTTSCKSACAVTNSIAYLPRSSTHGLLNHHSR